MIRDALLDASGFLVQDDSGLPYAQLEARGWKVQLYGKYGVPIPPFERAYQASLDRAFKSQLSSQLPFTFGYQFHDARDERSNVLVGQRPVQTAQADAAAIDSQRSRGLVLRSTAKRVQ